MFKMAFMFPGQGSQYLGMGADLYKDYSIVREIFEMTSDVVKKNIAKLCFEGPVDELRKTINLQPAITAMNLSCLSILENEGIHCKVSMGHSLGEYSALRAAKIFSLIDTIRVIFKRADLMEREAKKYEGGMCAILGLKINTVKEIIESCNLSESIFIASHNSKYQIIISGEKKLLKKITIKLRLAGARIILLNVNGPWHSIFMKGIAEDFSLFLKNIKIRNPNCSVIYNINHMISNDKKNIRKFLVEQLYSPVLWYDSILSLLEYGVDFFIEVGPGKVLTGLLNKILPKKHDYKIFNIFDKKTLNIFLEHINMLSI